MCLSGKKEQIMLVPFDVQLCEMYDFKRSHNFRLHFCDRSLGGECVSRILCLMF